MKDLQPPPRRILARAPNWLGDNLFAFPAVQKLRKMFPDAQITVQGDDGQHFAAMVIDESFRGKSRVQQQRAVNATLKAEIDSGNLHALALTTKAPD